MKRKSMITMLVIALMLVLSLTVLSACGKNKDDNKDDPPAKYSVTVTNGTGGGEYAEGATVKIKANAPETGKEFTSWTINGVSVDDKTKAEITFTMPANAVTATANYGDKAYLFALENCTADKETAKFGEEVTFTADEIIGKRFDSWNIKGVDDLTGLDLTKSPLTFTMPANDINVAAVLEDIDYTVTVTGGTANKTTAHYGDSITITAAAPATGKEFTGWTIEGVTVENTSVDELTFTMPAGNVTATANYDFIDYTVTVNGGTANKTTAHYGEQVTITANAPATGMHFTGWTLNGVTVENTSVAELTFTMPAGNVTATANYEFIDYTVTVNGGTAYTDGEPAGSITAEYGDFINIVAEVPTGKRFVKWTSDSADVVFDSETSETTSFEMPAGDITVTAVFEYIDYTVSVTGGTAQVNDGVASASVKAHYGEEVTITAEIPTGMSFAGWTLEGVTVNDKTKAELTFTMPANAVTATANYEYIDYNIKVTGGKAKVNGGVASASVKAHYGDSISIMAEIPTGMIFKGWTLEGVTAETGNFISSFTMPANDVTAKANYVYNNYKVTVNGGTADKTTAHYGEQVTITANAPETGKEFTSWTIEGVTVDDKTKAEITFTMPANAVTATANYDLINYTVTVNGGTAKVNGVETATAHYGDTVTITANEPGTNKEFIGWNSPDGVVFNNNASIETTFTMPASDVTVNAVFGDINKYSVLVNYDAGGAASDSQTAYCGDPVTITAKNIEGKIFVRWEINNLNTEGLDLTKSPLTFTMPANSVTANAIYEDLITLTFEGNIAQSEPLTYRKGASKTFRIELGDSQELCEYDISLTNKSCTFKVYDSIGNEIEPTDNGDGSMRIAVTRQDTYTIRVTYEGTSSSSQCTIKITASSPTV